MTEAISDAGVLALAQQMRNGTTSSVQATRWYLDQIERHNPALNAYLAVYTEQALAQASQTDQRIAIGQALGLLDGVPIALKDNIDLAGQITTNGVGALRNRRPEANATVATRLLDAGAVILGKLNMDEAAFGATTNNPHFGACDNPLMPGDVPGGSSGGSGCAVAAKLCAAALGTDTLGSVRIPAAYCGTVGLLPTQGLVSRTGVCALSPSLDRVGVLARRVDDAGAVVAQLFSYDPADPQSLANASSYASQINQSEEKGEGQSVRSLKIGLIDLSDQCDGPDAQAIAQAVNQTAQSLMHQGLQVQAVGDDAPDLGQLRRAALLLIETEGFSACQPWLSADEVSPTLKKMLAYGAGRPSSELEQAQAQLGTSAAHWQSLLTQFDVLMLPTAPQTSFSRDSRVPAGQADFTTPASIAGLPAISFPTGHTPAGRALSTQLIGRPFSEAVLMNLACLATEHF